MAQSRKLRVAAAALSIAAVATAMGAPVLASNPNQSVSIAAPAFIKIELLQPGQIKFVSKDQGNTFDNFFWKWSPQ
jgi:hypothetical protein